MLVFGFASISQIDTYDKSDTILRIPMKSAMHSNLKPAIDSDLKPAGYSDLMSAT